jgi:hypothetical protein
MLRANGERPDHPPPRPQRQRTRLPGSGPRPVQIAVGNRPRDAWVIPRPCWLRDPAWRQDRAPATTRPRPVTGAERYSQAPQPGSPAVGKLQRVGVAVVQMPMGDQPRVKLVDDPADPQAVGLARRLALARRSQHLARTPAGASWVSSTSTGPPVHARATSTSVSSSSGHHSTAGRRSALSTEYAPPSAHNRPLPRPPEPCGA